MIRDGKLFPEELGKLRFTTDQLEMKLRLAGITDVQDVKTATIETKAGETIYLRKCNPEKDMPNEAGCSRSTGV